MAMDNSPFISFMDTSFPLCHIWLPDRPWWPWCPRSSSKALISLATEVLFALAVLNLVGTPRGVQRSSCWRDEWHVWGYYISTFKTWEWWSLLDMFWVFVEVLTTCSYIFSLRHLETSWDTHPNTKGFGLLWGRHQQVDKNWRGFQVCRRARSTWNSASVTSSRGDQQQRLVEKQRQGIAVWRWEESQKMEKKCEYETSKSTFWRSIQSIGTPFLNLSHIDIWKNGIWNGGWVPIDGSMVQTEKAKNCSRT